MSCSSKRVDLKWESHFWPGCDGSRRGRSQSVPARGFRRNPPAANCGRRPSPTFTKRPFSYENRNDTSEPDRQRAPRRGLSVPQSVELFSRAARARERAMIGRLGKEPPIPAWVVELRNAGELGQPPTLRIWRAQVGVCSHCGGAADLHGAHRRSTCLHCGRPVGRNGVVV